MERPYYDELETRPAELREAALMAALPGHVAQAQARAPGWARILAGTAAQEVRSRADLARLPLTRKAELTELQAGEPPFGGLAAVELGGLARVFASPGPIFEPEAARPDYWRFGRALWAAGLRPGQVLHNCFSYHFTPAGSMMEGGARAVGAAVFPAGTGQTEQQVQAIARIRPHCYAGTPDFLKVIIEKAEETGADVASIRCAHVSGGAFMPDVRRFYAERGLQVTQSYGTADLGLVAYETPAREGLVLDEHVIVEIVRPGTGDLLPDGEVGEVVVTVLNPDYPMIRLATGDLSAILPGPSPCGRTNVRIKGWMGRADQTTKVKGMFVHPKHVAEILGRHPGLGRGRLVVERADGADLMTLRVEAPSAEPALAEAVAGTLQAVTKLKGRVELATPGSLPNDGKVIDDLRTYG